MSQRLHLDINAERVALAAAPWLNPSDPLEIALGARPLKLFLPAPIYAKDASPDVAAVIQFAANAAPLGVTDFNGSNVVAGSKNVADLEDDDDPIYSQEVDCAEDWATFALVSLFTAEPDARYKELEGQWRWRNGAEADADENWHYSNHVPIRVLNTITQSAVAPGAFTVGGMVYISSISDYSGGTSADLDALATVSLPLGTVVRIITENGESAWQLVGQDNATDVDAGYIQPIDYDADDNIKVWKRVAGV